MKIFCFILACLCVFCLVRASVDIDPLTLEGFMDVFETMHFDYSATMDSLSWLINNFNDLKSYFDIGAQEELLEKLQDGDILSVLKNFVTYVVDVFVTFNQTWLGLLRLLWSMTLDVILNILRIVVMLLYFLGFDIGIYDIPLAF